MQIKHVKSMNFLYFRTRTRVSELGRFVGVIARELYRDAVFQQLEVTGPLYWNYFGFHDKDEDEFILEIGLPVAEIPGRYQGRFNLKRETDYWCLSVVHCGTWFDIPTRYRQLNEVVQENGWKVAAHRREIYLNIDFVNPAGNITEIQLGLEDPGLPHGKRVGELEATSVLV